MKRRLAPAEPQHLAVGNRPSLEIQTELEDFDEYEMRFYDAQRARRLVAATELCSSRREMRHRQADETSALRERARLAHRYLSSDHMR